MADCTYPKCQQTAIPGCQGLCRDLSVNRRATDGQRAGVPEGYVVVPVELTPEMVKAGANSGGLGMNFHEWMGRLSTAWRHMLAAAPTPPAGTVFGIPAAHALLEWNRLQSEPPIKIGREYDVAKAYVAMMAPARDAGQ